MIIVLGIVSLFRSKPSRGTLSKSVTMKQFFNFCLKVILFIGMEYLIMLMSPPIDLSTLEKDSHAIIYFLMNNMMWVRMNVLCFFWTTNEWSHVVHKFICLYQFLTTCFSSYKYVAALRDAASKVYVVSKRVEARFVPFDSIDVCPINSHRSRCFSVSFRDEFMNVTGYSCALVHS